MILEKALIIDEPWISHILKGEKVWEMRSKPTKIRGNIGLIRKGSGLIVAVANLHDCGSALVMEEMIHNEDKHRIPVEKILNGSVSKWVIPWKLKEIQELKRPIPYVHKQGAVIWVNVNAIVEEDNLNG